MELDYNILKKIEQIVGDSWYILDLEKFKANYSEFFSAFYDIYPSVIIAYSYKTNYTPAICKTVNDFGGFAEVVSDMEYSLARDLGVNPSKIIVNGPYKPYSVLKKYLRSGSMVNIDSLREMEKVKSIAQEHKDIIFSIGLRCNFSIEGFENSRFGIDVDQPEFQRILREIANINNIKLTAIHCHYPYRDLKSFPGRIDGMLRVYDVVRKYCSPKYINLGGGWGGKISKELVQHIGLKNVNYQDYAQIVAHKLEEKFRYCEDKPILILEPGTALVANIMSFVCKVTDIKNIRGTHIAMTSGSQVNYHSRTSRVNLPIRVYSNNKQSRHRYDNINISGYTCMEEDYIYRGYSGALDIEDYVVVDNVGSYSIVFKPPFINPNVPIVVLQDNNVVVVKEKETYEDVFKTFKIGELLENNK